MGIATYGDAFITSIRAKFSPNPNRPSAVHWLTLVNRSVCPAGALRLPPLFVN